MPDKTWDIAGLPRKFKSMGDGTFAEVVVTSIGGAGVVQLWSDGTLLAAFSNVTSPWIEVAGYNVFRIGKTSAGGAHMFEIDWSRDGATADFGEVIAIPEKTTIEKPVAARYARFRIHNTDAVASFSSHRTNVYAR